MDTTPNSQKKSIGKRVPIVRHQSELVIPWKTFATVIGGRSIIDIKELMVENEVQAIQFLKSYGFDLQNALDLGDLNKVKDTALRYIKKSLLPYDKFTAVPETFNHASVSELLVLAGTGQFKGAMLADDVKAWSCLLLKVMHATAHAMWTHDTEAHAAALKALGERYTPFVGERQDGLWIGDENCKIPLVEFQLKANKKLFRTITKLLHKKGNLSHDILDHIGIRFVTEDIFAAILLIRFLRSRGLFMYANALPKEAKNSMIEFEEIQAMFSQYSPLIQVEDRLEPIESAAAKDEANGDFNRFSSRDFKMIKLIERLLVRLPSGEKVFFPYEIQILTRQTAEAISAGDSHHSEYINRQIAGVRDRLFNQLLS